ncbi:MAG: glycosyltransferase [Synechococcales bacterium]|nr:glycosyltransferase [Synechococcales bacterium]
MLISHSPNSHTDRPRISVIVPAYNVSGYLADALTSLEHQTFQDFEVLIVDDGSTDETAAIARSFSQRDTRFRLLQKPNGGLSSARNFGIAQAQGEYIALLDGDDAYGVDKLATHVQILDRDPQVGVVYSASRAMREDGKQTWMTLTGKPVQADPLMALFCKNFVGHGSNAVLRRCLFAEVGNFDETLPSVEDLDLWLRIAALRCWRFHRDPRVLCYYRVRPSGLSYNLTQMQKTHDRVIQAAHLRNPAETAAILPTATAYLYRYLARLAMTTGDTQQAQQLIQQAWQRDARIFWQDPRSLLTLLSVKFSPLAKRVIAGSLGTASTAK